MAYSLAQVPLHTCGYLLLIRYRFLAKSINIITAGLLGCCLIERQCSVRSCQRDEAEDHECCFQRNYSSKLIEHDNSGKRVRFTHILAATEGDWY